jgi:hypothetical protein
MTTLNLANFHLWQERQRELQEVTKWLEHIGKTGRSTRDHTDILRLSPGHCKSPSFSVAGQYDEGGQNYWDSPKAFDNAIKTVILSRFESLANEALTLLKEKADAALVASKPEIAALQMAIDEAERT